MNQDTLKGEWGQLKGRIRKRWGKLTHDDLDQIAGGPFEMALILLEKRTVPDVVDGTRTRIEEFHE